MTEIVIDNEVMRKRVIEHVAVLSPDKKWTVTIKAHTKKRSGPQNRLRWKWLDEVAKIVTKDTGMDKEDINEFFKRKFLAPERFEIGGESHEKYTTGTLSTQEMADYMNSIYAFVTSELGILLPLPEDR